MNDQIICEISKLSPTWVAVAISGVALFVVPFVTYKYAHKNSMKVLKEKWLSNLRDTSSSLVGACDKLYYANDARYQGTANRVGVLDTERKALQRRSEEAQAEVTAECAKLRLLFKDGSKSYSRINGEVTTLVSSVDKPKNSGGSFYMDTSLWQSAQSSFLAVVNDVIQTEWQKLSN